MIILSDQEIAQRKETVDPIDTKAFTIVERRRPTAAELEKYERFKATDSGISPISHPGMPGGNYLASGIEHNERGAPTASGEVHARMNDKRIRKLDPLKHRRDLFVVEGDPQAPLALVSWGSVAGVAREALELARREGIQAKLLVPKLALPGGRGDLRGLLPRRAGGLVVEQSHQGQLYRVLRMFVDVPAGVESLARSGSNPILPRRSSSGSGSSSSACSDSGWPRWSRRAEGGATMSTTTCPVEPYQAKDYKSDLKPIWCPGCGDFGVVQAIYRALARVGRPPHEIAFVSGIGCSSRIPGYTTAYGFNSVHGRALPIAQGIKLANPEPAGARGGRRRRRLLDRRRARGARGPPQHGPHLHRDGQPDLRPHQGPAVADLAARAADRVLDLGQPRGPGEPAALRARLRGELRRAGHARPTCRASPR